jgi:competence protein ComEC
MYIILSIFASYAVGIISYEYGFFAYFFTAVFAVLAYNSVKTRKFIYNTTLISFLVLSFINCNYSSKSSISQYINNDTAIVAAVKNKNKTAEGSYYSSCNAEILKINGSSLRQKENTIIYLHNGADITENSLIEFRGSVSEINSGKNFLLFNYKNYLRSRKIHAVVFTEGDIKVLKKNYSGTYEISSGFREYSENLFYKNLKKENADIILSVILGDVDYLDEDFYDNIKMMGLAHIFAVSGSHIVLLYAFILKALCLAGLKRRVSWSATWVLIWFYGFLIGFPVSVMRSLVMFTLLFGAEILYRRYNSLNSISLAALVLTIYNPYWLFDAGFILSFSAALALIIYSRYVSNFKSATNKIQRDAYMYVFLQIFTIPPIAYYFNYLPLMGILYNLMLLPVFTLILILSFGLLLLNVLSSLILAAPFKLFDLILSVLRFFINISENFALNGIEIRTLSIYEVVFFYVFIFLILYLKNCSLRKIVRKIMLAAYFSFYSLSFILIPLLDESLYVNIADSGQGLFSVLSYRNYNFIIDCGSTSNRNFGEYTAVPYLKKRGIKSIDGVFISHWDEDHYSGLMDIEKNMEVKNIFASSGGSQESLNEKVRILKNGDYFEVDERLKIYILWPDEKYQAGSTNNDSLVIKIDFGGKKLLFPGDIESVAENMLKGDLKSDILIVPHHGSNTSSGEKFVKETEPDFAVISCGKNSYGMPAEEVVQRYENGGSLIFSTIDDGEINFVLNVGKMYYNTYEGLKSGNCCGLYTVWIVQKLALSVFLLIWILNEREKRDEL